MKTAKKKTKTKRDKDTGFVDCEGRRIQGGQIVEYWDNEGGCGVGVIDFREKHWEMFNPWKSKEATPTAIIKIDRIKAYLR